MTHLVTPRHRGVITTADDVGLHSRVNQAVEQTPRHGIVVAASLMVCNGWLDGLTDPMPPGERCR